MNNATHPPGLSWDDYRFILAVGRAGSLNGAAKRLAVSHPTVFRRINAIERALGARLFERAREGYAPTPTGEEVIAVAAEIEARIGATERRLAGLDARPTGKVRLTTVEPLLQGLLVPLLAKFRRDHPGIVLEVVTDNALHDLGRREADLALRPGSKPPPDSLIGRRVARLAAAVYRPRSLRLPRGAGADDLAGMDWLIPDGSLGDIAMAHWLRRKQYDRGAVLRANSLLALRDAAVEGMGLTMLPCYLGDAERQLVRVGPPQPAAASDLWLLSHPDLRRTERVRVFADALREGFAALQSRLDGASVPGQSG
ncbi:LysR family transcriptional regulator [Pseudomonas sp. CGJS7]|uniref:LysR family transcriptional regulator n=1 Tax=Pseudomonas sp. CGJS7 TaxID=3109348 RepID=UPI003008074A